MNHSVVSKIYEAFDKMTADQFIQFMIINKYNLLNLEEYHIQLVKTETEINNLTKN